MYTCDFAINISITSLTHSICMLMQELYFEFKKHKPYFKGHLKIVVIRIRRFPVQTPLAACPVLWSQPCCKAPGYLWVKNVRTQ